MIAVKTLADIIRAIGPIRTVRVSSVWARGRAREYPYWGAVRYRLCLARDGWPVNRPLERGTSDRRSRNLAWDDARYLAENENRIMCQRIGRLDEETARQIVNELAARNRAVRELLAQRSAESEPAPHVAA